jgi:hypothetical protein
VKAIFYAVRLTYHAVGMLGRSAIAAAEDGRIEEAARRLRAAKILAELHPSTAPAAPCKSLPSSGKRPLIASGAADPPEDPGSAERSMQKADGAGLRHLVKQLFEAGSLLCPLLCEELIACTVHSETAPERSACLPSACTSTMRSRSRKNTTIRKNHVPQRAH